nr:hypothetical protein KPHV_40310 [Kitasatospora purpeofusca]
MSCETSETPVCECGSQTRRPQPDPDATPDSVTEWVCACGRFGIVLSPEYLLAHPDDTAVMVCGRKPVRSASIRSASVAA